MEICVEASSALIGSVTPKAALARRGVNRPVTQEQSAHIAAAPFSLLRDGAAATRRVGTRRVGGVVHKFCRAGKKGGYVAHDDEATMTAK